MESLAAGTSHQNNDVPVGSKLYIGYLGWRTPAEFAQTPKARRDAVLGSRDQPAPQPQLTGVFISTEADKLDDSYIPE
jgi:hypothetical protein